MISIDGFLLLRLLLSHFLADFLFQPGSWVKQRQAKGWASPWLYLHGAVAGALAYLMAGNWAAPWLIPVIAISHIGVDGWLKTKPSGLWAFVIDQLLHLAVVAGCWFLLISDPGTAVSSLAHWIQQPGVWVLVLSYFLVLHPAGLLISEIIRRLFQEQEREGLANAGLWIGCLERSLIVTFVLLDQYAAIGFLVAAKSVFRFPEISEHYEKGSLQRTNPSGRGQAEYFIIGTLLSFLVAILIGLAAKSLIARIP